MTERLAGWRSNAFLHSAAGRSLALGVLVVLAVVLRVALPWNAVFGQEYVSFVENDAWYHMRLVDSLVRHFPWRIWHDPYLVHPHGEAVNAGPMLDWIVAAAALMLGAGTPSPRLVDVVGAWVPPLVGALTILPVYVIGRTLFTPAAGLWAGLLIAVMPGEFLFRSLLGYTDHHCLEVLLSTTALMCVVVSARRAGDAGKRRWAAAAGVTLGAYLLTWSGGLVIIGILVLWTLQQLLTDVRRGVSSSDLLQTLLPCMAAAAVVIAPWILVRPSFAYQMAALIGAIVLLGTIQLGRRVAERHAWSVWWSVGLALVLCGAALGAASAVGSLDGLMTDLARISPFRARGFVAEAQPLIGAPQWRPVPLWIEFAAGLPLAIAGVVLLWTARVSTPGSREASLLVVWTAVMLAATFGQVRFLYYLAVNVALLAGFAAQYVVAVAASVRIPRWATAVLLACAIVGSSAPRLKSFAVAPASVNPNWYDALLWLNENSPEPFDEPGAAYYAPWRPAGAASSYGVLALWDYGYWITRIARRVPVGNPRQTGVRDVTEFLLAQNEHQADRVADRLAVRYVVVDWQLQAPFEGAPGGGFHSLVVAAGRNPSDYCGWFARRDSVSGAAQEARLYCYPEYYQTMAVRLFQFGGRAAAPNGPVTVVTFRRAGPGRGGVNVITDERRFATYDEARRHVTASGRSNVRIVSKSRASTCVPLQALAGYRPVFRSLDRDTPAISSPPAVQVFEYAPVPSRNLE